MKKKLKVKNIIYIMFLIIFLAMFLYSGYKIVCYLIDNKNNRDLDEKTKQYIEINDQATKIDEKYEIDWAKLKNHNPNTVAYLKVNGTNIDYIVVRGNDNSYYLRRTFDRTWNASGWIFGDYRNDFDGSDKNLIIYGHNTKDGSMFGTLRNVLTEDWQSKKENLKIELVTEKGKYIYEVFSTYIISPEEYYITTYFGNIDFNNFVKEMASRYNKDYGVDLSNVSSILTLSTCSDNLVDRVVLHAKLIEKTE